MKLATRPALVRLTHIHQALRRGGWPSAPSLARELEVSKRTVLRDLDYLRDRLGAPVHYDPRRKGFCYQDPGYQLPLGLVVTEGELVALFLAERVLRQFRGTPYQEGLERAFRKLTALLPEQVSVQLQRIEETLSVTPTVLTVQDVETFRTITTALRECRRLEVDYWTASRNARGTRAIDPYHLTLIDGDWQVVAYCHRRRDVRMFATQRIKAARLTDEAFERPDVFDIQEYLRGSFRAVRGDGGKPYEVRLGFSPVVAGRIAEKVWHPSQVTKQLPDGGLELSFQVTALVEVLRWVLSWGGDVRVLAPTELRTLVRRECQRVLALCKRRPRIVSTRIHHP